jgi:hypothetical protein
VTGWPWCGWDTLSLPGPLDDPLGLIAIACRCITCPATAWLLFLLFSLAILAAVTSAVYLSKKRINMAGLSVGLVCAVAPGPWDSNTLYAVARGHAKPGGGGRAGSSLGVPPLQQCSVSHWHDSRNVIAGVCLWVPNTLQDFVQVLSMFAGFDFDWPPAVKGIFNAFSLVNFNFELLAPDCSVSLNFEAKWWGTCCIFGVDYAFFPALCR